MNRRQIVWRAKAKVELRSIDQPTALRILQALAAFAATGEGDVQRLQGIDPPEFRLRVGDYRLRFHDYGHGLYGLPSGIAEKPTGNPEPSNALRPSRRARLGLVSSSAPRPHASQNG